MVLRCSCNTIHSKSVRTHQGDFPFGFQSYVESVVCSEEKLATVAESEGCASHSSAAGGEDSSYDSDCDNEGGGAHSPASHDGVSRTASDTLGAEFAEYVTDAPAPSSDGEVSGSSYNARVEFGLKLGYTEKHVLAALQKLGPNPAQNELLAELIRLGAQQQQLGTSSTSRGGLEAGAGSILSTSVSPTPNTSALSLSPTPNNSTIVSNPPTPNSSSLSSGATGDRTDDADSTQAKDVFHPCELTPRLRPIVVDGSNVAMSHGNKEVYSCRGIKLCVDWFKARGHKEITVFVPKWRKEASRPYHPIKDQEILGELERERLLVFTPSRLVGGKRMVCYDDRYILRLAAEIDGIVVSNDNYRDLAQESPEFRKVVEERILMYSFVNDRFMPPDDPLGRSGPTLDNFLSHHPAKRHEIPPLCPYGKKCTYGNKCRFHHPERGPLPHKSVTERLQEHAQKQLMEVKARATGSISAGDHIKGKSLSLPLQSVSSDQDSGTSKRQYRKTPLSRTRSTLVNPLSMMPPKDCENHHPQLSQASALSLPNCRHMENSPGENGRMASPHQHNLPSGHDVQSFRAYSPSPGFSQLHHPQLHPIHCQQQWGQMVKKEPGGSAWSQANMSYGDRMQMADRSSDSDRNGEKVNLHRKLQRQLTLNPSCDPRLFQMQGYVPAHEHQPLARHASGEAHFPGVTASPVHQNVTRIASAPDSFQRWPQVPHTASHSHGHHLIPQTLLPRHHHMQRLSSTSDPQLNLGGEGETVAGDPFDGGSWYPYTSEHSPSIWSPNVLQSSVSGLLQPTSQFSYASDDPEDARHRLQYHLSSIFPAEHVRTAMEIYPDETNPQKICAAILSMFPKS
ncbi:hypothetical protein J437_LFUL011331 [Ladona fulva]|uniref:C3H1-type domain-containing protein n=1 Tax=Ladona fulva TaxID=123851 RepID=A0A8K0P0P7_LADFU|nr:hypothetical protein J437_LFUL011331 [Ladona fulva]